MAPRLYTSREIEKIKASGLIAYETHMHLREHLKEGVSTYDLDRYAGEFIAGKGAIAAFKGFKGFPGSICASINDVVVHGIPRREDMLKNGDIIGIDIGILYDGYYSDTAWTWPVGEVSEEVKNLIRATQRSLYKGIKEARQGNRIGAIGHSVQTYVEERGFSVVRSLVGHGVGKSVHEEPQIPNFGRKKSGLPIKDGWVLAIEPMINQGVYDVYTDKDNWSVRTKDGKLSAHFEHTVAVTASGPVICTAPEQEMADVF